ncbi:hypothetical protein ACU4GD_21510 [Cupriavidus basilensis]
MPCSAASNVRRPGPQRPALLLPGNIHLRPRRTGQIRSTDAPQTHPSAGASSIAFRRPACADPACSLIGRAGDFFGPRTTANSWAVPPPALVTTRGGRCGGCSIRHAGDQPQWAYLPDVAATMVRLCRETWLHRVAALQPLDGPLFWDPDGRQMVAAIIAPAQSATCRSGAPWAPPARRAGLAAGPGDPRDALPVAGADPHAQRRARGVPRRRARIRRSTGSAGRRSPGSDALTERRRAGEARPRG